MKRILTILIALAFAAAAFSQDTITVLHEVDFDMFAVQDTMYEDTLLKITGANNAYEVEQPWWNIIDNDGDRVTEWLYPYLQCCIGFIDNNLDAGPWLGTAGGLRYNINGSTHYEYMALSWNMKLSENFGAAMQTSGGVKIMGLWTPSTASYDDRVAFHELELRDSDSITIRFYDWTYPSDASTATTVNTNWGSAAWGEPNSCRYDTIPQGVWVNMTEVIYSGTVGSANGWHALYKNGVCIGVHTDLRFHSNANGGQVDFRDVSMDGTAGGADSDDYNFLEDASMEIDNVIAWTYDSMDEITPYGGQVINLPAEADFPKGSASPPITTTTEYLVDGSGNPIQINGSLITFNSETPTPPEPEWEDSVQFTNLYFEDWQDFTVTNTSTTTSPNGIPNDSLAAHITNFEALTADGGNDPNKADNADIVELMIDAAALKVLRSWYPEGHCCTGGASDSGLNGGLNNGTGIEFVASITEPYTHTKQIILHYWIRFGEATDVMGLFENPEGVKQPGVVVDYDADKAIARTMILNYSIGTQTDPAFYTYAYHNQPGDWVNRAGPVANTKTKAPETWYTPGWHIVSLVVDAGTAQAVNGWMHLYIDGKLIDDGAGGGTLNNLPFLNNSDPAGWRQLKFASFMGGDNEDYNSPKDQALDFGPIAIETQDNYNENPDPGDDIYIPKYMKNALMVTEPPVVWVDSLTVFSHTDWNDIAEQTDPLYATITDETGNLNFVGAELIPYDGIFNTLAITDMGSGDMALEAIYPENSCCTESDQIGEGTGGYWEFFFNANEDQFQDVWFDYTIEFESGFTIPTGLKIPGITNSTLNSPQRMMLIDTPVDTVFQMQWYNDVFSDDLDSDPERYSSTGWGLSGITLTVGTTYRITQRYYATSSGDGGFHYLFIDGILVAKRTGARFNSSVTTTSYWDSGNMSLFMGGEDPSYNSDHNQSHFTDNYSWFKINDDVSTITEGQTLDLGYDISDILEAIDTYHDN